MIKFDVDGLKQAREKLAFVPMPGGEGGDGGMPPEMGGMPPPGMEGIPPEMMGGMPPEMMGGMPPPEMMDPSLQGGSITMSTDELFALIQMLLETGGKSGGGGEGMGPEGEPKRSAKADQSAKIDAIAAALGIPV